MQTESVSKVSKTMKRNWKTPAFRSKTMKGQKQYWDQEMKRRLLEMKLSK